MQSAVKGHLLAFFAVVIWGMTFISSKVLVGLLDPYWYIVIRFLIAWGFLFLLAPRPIKLLPRAQEGRAILCGIAGVTLYYIFQNVALVYGTASNTGVITASSPLFTALILWLFGRKVKLSPLFFLGFLLCIGGVAAISFGGGSGGELHLLGDAFALASAAAWGIYCTLIGGTESYGLSELQITRKVFFWGALLSFPAALLLGEPVPAETFTQGGLPFWGNLLFVALGSSALCYLFWGKATNLIGAVTTSVYLYLIPVVSVVGSALILGEPVTVVTVAAIGAIFVGLFLSQKGNVPV